MSLRDSSTESSELAALAKQVKALRRFVVLAWITVIALMYILYTSLANQRRLIDWMVRNDKEFDLIHQRFRKIEAKKP